MLLGEMAEADIAAAAKGFVSRHFRACSTSGGLSLDEIMSGMDRGMDGAPLVRRLPSDGKGVSA